MNSPTGSPAPTVGNAHIQSYARTKTLILGRRVVRQDQARITANLPLRIDLAFRGRARQCKVSRYFLVLMLPALPTAPTGSIHKSMSPPRRPRPTTETTAQATPVLRIRRMRRHRLLLVKGLCRKRIIKQQEARRTYQQEHRRPLLSQRLLQLKVPIRRSSQRI